jgi:hypothetical protein
MKNLFGILLYFLVNAIVLAQEPTLITTDACGDKYTGQMAITFTHDMNLYPLPYTGEYYMRHPEIISSLRSKTTLLRLQNCIQVTILLL